MTTTRAIAIGGGKDFPIDARARGKWLAEAAAASGVDERRLDLLLIRYGTKALRIARHQSGWNREDRLPDSIDFSASEIDYIVRNEFVERLADVVMRRTTLAIGGSLTKKDLELIAAISGRALRWDAERMSGEIDAVIGELRDRNLMRI